MKNKFRMDLDCRSLLNLSYKQVKIANFKKVELTTAGWLQANCPMNQSIKRELTMKKNSIDRPDLEEY